MGWLIFAVVAAALLAADLMTSRRIGFRGSLVRTAIYIVAALAFGAFVWLTRGADDGVKFLTGYALEGSLSLDNVFVISLIFGALSIPAAQRHRVLLIGIATAVVLRGAFIGLGAFAVGQFRWLLIGCGAFLIYTAIKGLMSGDEEEVDIEKNRALGLLRRFVPITPKLHGGRFIVAGAVTPLLVALVLVEIADLIFAADSVPATLAVTSDPFLVYTSNIFAILGLRSLYYVLERLVSSLEYVGKAVAVVLGFIGVKVITAQTGLFEIPNGGSLAIVLALLLTGITASLIAGARHAKA